MPRNYKQEYARYQGTPEQKKRRADVIKLGVPRYVAVK